MKVMSIIMFIGIAIMVQTKMIVNLQATKERNTFCVLDVVVTKMRIMSSQTMCGLSSVVCVLDVVVTKMRIMSSQTIC